MTMFKSLVGVFTWRCVHLLLLDLLGSKAVESCCNTTVVSRLPLNLPPLPSQALTNTHTHTHVPDTRNWDQAQNTQLGRTTEAACTHKHAQAYIPPLASTHLYTQNTPGGNAEQTLNCWVIQLSTKLKKKKKKSTVWSCFISLSPGLQTAHNLKKLNPNRTATKGQRGGNRWIIFWPCHDFQLQPKGHTRSTCTFFFCIVWNCAV